MWEKAGWFSTVYLNSINGDKANRLMLTFKEGKVAEWLFQDLLRFEENGYIDALQVTFIKGKKGQAKYYLKLGVNTKFFEEYLRKNNLKDSLILCSYIYRQYNIDPYNDLSIYYTEKAFQKNGYIEMSYISLNKESNIVLKTRNVSFKEFESMKSNDIDYDIIKNDNN